MRNELNSALKEDYDSWRDDVMVVNYDNFMSYTSYLITYQHDFSKYTNNQS